jgi:hypothetical protein
MATLATGRKSHEGSLITGHCTHPPMTPRLAQAARPHHLSRRPAQHERPHTTIRRSTTMGRIWRLASGGGSI